MEGLGRLFNAVPSATTTATPVSLQDAAAVTIFLYGATSGNATIQQLTAISGGTAVNFDGSDAAHGSGITRYFTWAAGVWTLRTQAAAATITAVTGGLAAVHISASSLSDGFKYVSASHASGSFLVVLHDLEVQRKASNLRSPIL